MKFLPVHALIIAFAASTALASVATQPPSINAPAAYESNLPAKESHHEREKKKHELQEEKHKLEEERERKRREEEERRREHRKHHKTTELPRTTPVHHRTHKPTPTPTHHPSRTSPSPSKTTAKGSAPNVGSCGDGASVNGHPQSCAPGFCCSSYGYCGQTPDYCGTGCNPKYGDCGAAASSAPPVPQGACGKKYNVHCANELCCSYSGFCGSSLGYCGNGCQAAFGKCNPGISDNIDPTGITCGPSSKGKYSCSEAYCCSASGTCGSGAEFCGTGCQKAFGQCS